MATHASAEVFPPGEFLRDELEARDWTQEDFAKIVGMSVRSINQIIVGKQSITPDAARSISKALGTSAELWMNLETAYKLSQIRETPGDDTISRKAKLYTYPIRELCRRTWIQETSNVDDLEDQVCGFLGASSIQEIPHIADTLPHAARRTGYSDLSPTQIAWLSRVKQLASVMKTSTYTKKKLLHAIELLRWYRSKPQEIRNIPHVLSEAGVRFVVVEGLRGSKIDGVCLWLDAKSPVVAMTLRHDRIDNFWFVLRHEIEHVLRGNGKGKGVIDEEIGVAEDADSEQLSHQELLANAAAEDFCAPRDALIDFADRVDPHFSDAEVANFAESIGIHPGLVVGQLHFLGKLPFSHLRKGLIKIRHLIIETAMRDGWGYMPQIKGHIE